MTDRGVQTTPTQTRPAAQRDWVIDILRVGAVFVVVLMHWVYLRITLVEGSLQIENALHGPFFWAASWVLQVMPAFFLAGGFANTVVLDRSRAKGQEYGAFLGLRARRLLTPLVPLIAVALGFGALAAALNIGAADNIGDQFGNPLWFLGVYLLCVTFAGVAVWVHDRLGWWVLPVVLLAGSLTVDLLRFGETIPTEAARWANLALVWLFCHQLGVLHARGTLRTRATWVSWAVIVLGVGALVLMVLPGPYFPTNLGMADAPVSNLMPPTSALSVLGVVQLGVLTLVSNRLRGWQPSAPMQARIGRLNALLMVIYLWHVPALTLVTGLGLLLPDLLLPTDEPTWWLVRPIWFVLAGALLWVFVRMGTAWELWCQRFQARDVTHLVLLGALLGTIGTTMLWFLGIALTPLALTGSVLVLLAVGLLTTLVRRPAAS